MVLIGNIKGEPGVPGSGGVPVGAILPWMGLLATPPLPVPFGFQLCDGSAINDPDSPFNGGSTPPLNGTDGTNKRFIRGSSNTVGGITGSLTHTHSLFCGTAKVGKDTGQGHIDVMGPVGAGNCPVQNTGVNNDQETNGIPPCFDTEFIVRIK